MVTSFRLETTEFCFVIFFLLFSLLLTFFYGNDIDHDKYQKGKAHSKYNGFDIDV